MQFSDDQNINAVEIPNEGAEPQSSYGGMRAPHRPSRMQAVLFLIFSLLVAGGLAVWELYLNHGTLAFISGSHPFTVNVNGKDIVCEKSPCSVELEPKKYPVVMRREGYKDDAQEATVKRFETTTLEPNFIFIPTLQEVDTEEFSRLLPLTAFATAPAKSLKLPYKAENIFFNSTGNLAVILTEKGPQLYGVKSNTLTKLSFGTGIPFAWSGSFLTFLATNKAGGQTLFSYGAEADTPLVVFERPLTRPSLFGSPEGKFVLLQDNTLEGIVYYLVDIQAGSRRRLTITADQKFAGFVGDYGIFSEAQTNFVLISLTETAAPITLPNAAFSASLLWKTKKSIYYITPDESTDSISGGATLSIEDALKQINSGLEDVQQDMAGAQKVPDVRYQLTRFDLDTKKTTPLAPLVLKQDEVVSEIAVVEEKIAVRAGGKIYQLITEEI